MMCRYNMIESFSFSPASDARLDQALADCGREISRRGAKRLLTEQRVVVNGKVTAVASRFISTKDRVSVIGDEPLLPVLVETADYIGLDKPAGIASQPSAEQTYPSCAEIAASRLRRRGETNEIFVVHRIDLNTTGALILAKNAPFARRASTAFRDGSVQKTYVALLHGELDDERVIETAIGRVDAETFGVTPSGKHALTIVRPLAVCQNVTLAEVEIRTGRTHQIRVHLSSIGHPVIGDRKYTAGLQIAADAGRPLLHARFLKVAGVALTAPLPADFAAFAERRRLAPMVTFLHQEQPAPAAERI